LPKPGAVLVAAAKEKKAHEHNPKPNAVVVRRFSTECDGAAWNGGGWTLGYPAAGSPGGAGLGSRAGFDGIVRGRSPAGLAKMAFGPSYCDDRASSGAKSRHRNCFSRTSASQNGSRIYFRSGSR
jgi:hypothetical protein